MRSWHRLNIDVSDAVAKGFKLGYPPEPGIPQTGQGIYLLRPDSKTSNRILSPEWKANLQSIIGGAKSIAVIVFVTPKEATYDDAHIDLTDDGTRAHSWSLNWVEFYDDERDMVWYKPTETNRVITARSPVGNYYQYMEPTEDAIIDRCRIGKQLTLVRTDIPHCIASLATCIQPVRVAVSLRPDIPGVVTWEDAVEYFQPFMADDLMVTN